MANESFANSTVVEVAGSPLPTDVASLLSYVTVEGSRNLPDQAVLRFRDPQHTVLTKAGISIGTKLTVKVNTAEPGGPTQLMSGEVTAVELDLDTHGSLTEVRALDPAHRLFRGRRVAAYPNMSIREVVTKVCERAGLTTGTIDAIPEVAGQQHTQLSQDNVSDWEFLSRMANTVGAQVTASDGKLSFRLPAPPAEAPATSASATTDALVLEEGRNLVALRASISAAEQVPEVEARGWDSEHKQVITTTSEPTTAGTEVSGLSPTEMAQTFNSPPYLLANPTLYNQSAASGAAKAAADQLGGACAELEGLAKGNPKLLPGAAITLVGVGSLFAGKYTLTSTRHLFSEQAGYTTSFTASGRQERSLYGLTSAGKPAGGTAGPFGGLVPALVTDVQDPLELGRVRLKFPWLSDEFTSGWARTVQAGAGNDRGAMLMPEVGDEVLAGFAMGDLNTPYVLGGLHNGQDLPPQLSAPVVDGSSGEVGVRALVSRTGHRLELIDADNGAGVLLSTGDNKLLLKFDKQSETVELTSSGPIKITGVGVTVDSGTGALELKGQSVKVTGQTSVELSGQQVKVAGQAAAELSASGPVTVRGGVVRIN